MSRGKPHPGRTPLLTADQERRVLGRLTTTVLTDRYAHDLGEPTTTRNKAWLLRRIAWRLQARAEGGLSERAKKRAAELADADLRVLPLRGSDMSTDLTSLPKTLDARIPPPGTVLIRPYKGGTVKVRVLAEGYAYEGETFKTLSAVAKKVTGTHTNGFLFFQLGTGGDA
jgi:hypothetical protein